MHDISLYEKKIISDKEFPVQMFVNRIDKPTPYCPSHWHEHLELHYVLQGEGAFYLNRKPFNVEEGDLLIINSNELHEGESCSYNFDALVVIFEMDSFSREIANFNVLFQSHIKCDNHIQKLLTTIYQEEMDRNHGYKLAMKGKIYELITYLLRNYVIEKQSARENTKRNKNLKRLNTVLSYIHDNYAEPITNKELANLIHVSEFHFSHIFKDAMGMSPLNYVNEVRLKKAFNLLEQKEMTISEIAIAVGFQDYNNFGRQFRRLYGYAPSHVWEL